MISANFIRRILLEELNPMMQQLKDKWVGEGKPVSQQDFEKILDAAQNKFYLTAWLLKKVGSKIIKNEDIYKYKEYFNIFEKNKKEFEFKDIHLYKTPEDLQKFIDSVLKVREGGERFEDIVQQQDRYVSPNDIKKLESSGEAKYLGMWNNYQAFQIHGYSPKTWKLYRDILGRCRGRGGAKGAKIDICTIARYEYFEDYLKDHRGSNYFLLFDLDDPKSPYQLHYESGQFMNRQDREKYPFEPIGFYEWLAKKVPKYSLEKLRKFDIEIPYPGKGTVDANGKKQGIFVKYSDGTRDSISNYVDGVEEGRYVEFGRRGVIAVEANYNKGRLDGPYVEYDMNSDSKDVEEQGTYKSGEKVGIWKYKIHDRGEKRYNLVDESGKEMSGLSKDNLFFVSQHPYGSRNPMGKTIVFYPSGSIRAIGNLTPSGKPTGVWTFYFENGAIQAEGRMTARGKRIGEWVDFLKTKEGTFLINSLYENEGSFYPISMRVYDKNGHKIDKSTAKDIAQKFKDSGWDILPSKILKKL